MKKSTLLLSAAMIAAAGTTYAQDPVLANPTLPDGSFIVKYDMENKCFAADNDFEVDETVVIAVDITGTDFETKVKESSRNPQVLGRGIAHDFYVNNDVTELPHYAAGNIDGRLFHIEGNIYGAVFNLFQCAQGRYKDSCFGWYKEGDQDKWDALEPGKVVTFGANIFPFGWSATNQGAEWWDGIATPITTLWFTTKPYTGSKTSEEFFFDDFNDGEVWPGCSETIADKGYAQPQYWKEAMGDPTGVEEAGVENADAPVEYYNIQGIRVANPENGLYIRRHGSDVQKVILK